MPVHVEDSSGPTSHVRGSFDIHTQPKAAATTKHISQEAHEESWRDIPSRAYVSFVMGCVVMLVAGVQYAFSAWSDDFKQQGGFSQSQVEIVGAMGTSGTDIAVLGGMMFDVYGTRKTMIFAAVMAFAGFFPMYMTSAGFTPFLSSTGVQGFFYLIALFGCLTAYIVSLGCNAQAFPDKHRGLVVGSQLGFFALSATLYTGIYTQGFGNNLAGFQLMLSIVVPAVFCIGSFFLAPSEGAKLTHSYNREDYKVLAGNELEFENEELKPQINVYKKNSYVLLQDGNGVVLHEAVSPARRIWNVFVEKMKSFTFWLLFIQYFIGAGCGWLFINNVGQISKSLNFDKQNGSAVFVCVTLFSVCSALGRFATALTDYVHIRRGWWFIGVGIGNAVSYLIATLAFTEGSFTVQYIVAITLGLTYGMLSGLIAAVVSEEWGTDDFAQNLGWLFLGTVGASYAFNGFAGKFYDLNAVTHPGIGDTDCVGTVCYRLSYIIAASISVFTACSGIILAPRTCYPGEGKESNNTKRARIESSVSVRSVGV